MRKLMLLGAFVGIGLVACEDAVGPDPMVEDDVAGDSALIADLATADGGSQVGQSSQGGQGTQGGQGSHQGWGQQGGQGQQGRQGGQGQQGGRGLGTCDICTFRADWSVGRAFEGIQLTTRLLGEDPPAGPIELLEQAMEMARQAEAALDAGQEERAAALGRQAEMLALRAYAGRGRISAEEIRTIAALADTLLREATEAVGPEPTEEQAALLRVAAWLQEQGLALLETQRGNGNRGVALLWHSATTSALLLGG